MTFNHHSMSIAAHAVYRSFFSDDLTKTLTKTGNLTVTSQRDLLNVRRPSLGGTLGTESKVEGHILTLFTDTGLIFHNDALDTGNTWLCESPEQLVLS